MSSRCKGCQAPVEWAKVDGKNIPLDVRAPTYEWKDTGDPMTSTYRPSAARVSHFATCPAASQFSKRNAQPDEMNSEPEQRSLWYQGDDR